MSAIDILYLSVVLVAFFGFAGTLAYVAHRDRLPTERPYHPFTNLPPI